MHIPLRLENILRKDQSLYGAVLSTIAAFEPWIKPNQPFFFPEYTDHGLEHIEQVLQTAVSLVREEAWAVLSPGDAATLTLATLLHDSAMHLTPDGFVGLVREQSVIHSFPEFGDTAWYQLWNSYIDEARRFDGRALEEKFGLKEPISLPNGNLLDWSENNRRVVGEFLRRHHPRLAHEIALYGVTGPGSNRLKFQNVPEDLADLIGLVARSHGLPLRTCIDYLAVKYSKRTYQGIQRVSDDALARCRLFTNTTRTST